MADLRVRRLPSIHGLPRRRDQRDRARRRRAGRCLRRCRQAAPARLAPSRHGAACPRRRSGPHLDGTDPRGAHRGHGLHHHRRSALRHLGGLPPGPLGRTSGRRAAPLGPRQHLPHHRGQLHAHRGPGAALVRRAVGARGGLGRSPGRGGAQAAVAARAALGGRAAVHRARLGGRRRRGRPGARRRLDRIDPARRRRRAAADPHRPPPAPRCSRPSARSC